jgi:hypothetical protein
METERTPENINQKKESFILYLEQLKILDELTDEEAGILFKAIKSFVYTGTIPVLEKLLKIAFIPIYNQLKMDLKKWRDTKEKRSIAGLQGGRPSKAKKANGFLEKQTKAKKAVNVNENVNVNVNEYVNDNVFLKTINDFKNHRVRLKKPMTDRAIELLLIKLKSLANTEEEQIEILNQSIENGWVGIFELKKENKKNEPFDLFKNYKDKEMIIDVEASN